MLGFDTTTPLGADRDRFAEGGATPRGRVPHRQLSALLALFAGLLLAACQQPQGRTLGQLHLAGAAEPAPAPTRSTQAESPAPKPTPLAATPAVVRGDAPLPVRLTGDPKELIGLDNSAIRRVLGVPTQVRHEPAAQVWQYVTGDCVVDLYLYDEDDDGLKVTYVEARSHTAEQAPTGRCLKSLLERPTASAQ